jgi:OmcA/MtrC family decaheme c-type cytochrome
MSVSRAEQICNVASANWPRRAKVMNSWIRVSASLLCALALASCGGGGGGDSTAPPGTGGGTTPSTSVQAAIAKAAGTPANDTSTNSSASFTVLQEAGVPAVTINSPPKVNFAVFSDGKAKTDLALSNVSFAIAKLVPGAPGNVDQWVNYIYRTETATAGVGPGGKPVLASAKQATTDGKQTDPTLAAAQLVLNPDGYYTYTFKTDIKNPAQTNGVVFEPGLTHRVAIQLSYKNAAGATILVNPYFDFTVGTDGNSIAVTDPAKTKKMTDVASCNTCHEKLALHGGGRVDTQFCVMCHNPGTTDANSGNVLTLSTMVHKIHAGKLLKAKLDAGQGGEDYTIWGYQDSKNDYADVGFPQDLRNCTVCHSGANPATPQGDNWKTKPSRQACLTCHASLPGSDWFNTHKVFNGNRDPNAPDTLLKDGNCAACHLPPSAVSPERVHFNQVQVNAAKYKMNIDSVAFDAATRKVTVKYFLSDPTNGNAAYNLVTPDCTGTSTIACGSNTKFGNLRFYVAYQNMIGQSAGTTEYSSYNNAGSGANAFAYTGANDGSNHYTVQISIPADSTVTAAFGTARVISIGQIKEPLLVAKSIADPRPEVTPKTLVNTAVQHTSTEFAITGVLQPRRAVVSNDKCNACHGMLGTASGANTLANAFHSGARDIVEACVVCHDPNRASTTVMTNGLALNESFQFKRMIHGIHGNSKRTFPFTHGNAVIGVFNKDGTSASGGAPLASTVTNYAAEVAYPQVSLNCNSCHVDNSYKLDRGTLGATVISTSLSKDATSGAYSNPNVGLFESSGACIGGNGTVAAKTLTSCAAIDMNKLPVISHWAAACTACHDSPTAIGHVTSFGNASFGNRTQAQAAQATEICADCHASGGFKGVDIVHNLP